MIGFNLTEEQKEMQAFFRKFSQERVKAAAEKMDEEEKMDMDAEPWYVWHSILRRSWRCRT